ncbi:ABC transporter permease [Fulvivirga sp.]|uniref:ABC transporter permease n=1 Tax=Fulvivirga sp. TaxID=1931237 RepID=UPI0032F00BCB
MYKNLLSSFYIAFDAVLANKMRSILTALGIIFGVAAVIAMLAIGNGAQKEILEQIKLVGVNNIVITPIVEQTEEEVESSTSNKEDKNFSPGLTLNDVRSIQEVVPGIEKISPEILLETYIIKNGIRRTAKLVGVENNYFDISNFTLSQGKFFNSEQLLKGEAVCIIGQSIKSKFFSTQDPIGKMIKVGAHWLMVIGVLEERLISEKSIENLGIRNYNMDVYTPLKTVLIRYKNRALITEALIKRAANMDNDANQSSEPKQSVNYHQLDRLVLQVNDTEKMLSISEIVSRILKRRHFETVDYEITIPELLLKQQQRTKNIFNFVLGAIAGISLLVGGIGIMNIMLASVLERIKEIGLRLAIGAKKTDIIYQFVFEAVMISVSGGIIGIILGVTLAFVVSEIAEIPTIISVSSIILSFGVAATVGLIFGIAPARRAAQQDPISSLRYE